MAKGDMGGGNASAQQPPKTDQYSVMHKIMDAFGSPNTSIAPSALPPMPQQQSFLPGDQPFPQINGGNMGGRFHPLPNGMSPNNWGISGGQNFGGVAQGGGSLAPSNPQDMMRRSMIGKGTFGQ